MKSEIWIDELIGGCKVTLVQNFIDQSEYQRLIIRQYFHQALPNDSTEHAMLKLAHSSGSNSMIAVRTLLGRIGQDDRLDNQRNFFPGLLTRALKDNRRAASR
jgi:hypothetical protein